MGPKKILVGHDGSAYAEAALDYACHLAKRLGAEVVVLTVKHYIQHVAGYVDERMMARREEFYRRIEEAIRAQLERNGVEGRVETVEGHPPEALADYASENGCDLIVVGARGLRGVSRLLLGSTAEQVVRLACVPVLVYRTC